MGYVRRRLNSKSALEITRRLCKLLKKYQIDEVEWPVVKISTESHYYNRIDSMTIEFKGTTHVSVVISGKFCTNGVEMELEDFSISECPSSTVKDELIGILHLVVESVIERWISAMNVKRTEFETRIAEMRGMKIH